MIETINSILDLTNEQIIKRYLKRYMNSKDSVIHRRSALSFFFEEKGFGFDKHVSEITKASLIDYFDWLKSENWTKQTKINRWSMLKSFIDFCMEYYDDFVVKFPSKKLVQWGEAHKASKSNKRVIATEAELKMIEDYLKPRNFKQYVIFRMLRETGMRIGGLTNIEIQNVNLQERSVLTTEKTGRKLYFYPKSYANVLNIYIEGRKLMPAKNDYLFITQQLNQFRPAYFDHFLKGNTRSTKDGNRHKKGLREIVGIQQNITPHTYRRTINKLRKVKKDCPWDTLKILLGHATKDSKLGDTNVDSYTPYEFEEKRALYDKYYPYNF